MPAEKSLHQQQTPSQPNRRRLTNCLPMEIVRTYGEPVSKEKPGWNTPAKGEAQMSAKEKQTSIQTLYVPICFSDLHFFETPSVIRSTKPKVASRC